MGRLAAVLRTTGSSFREAATLHSNLCEICCARWWPSFNVALKINKILHDAFLLVPGMLTPTTGF